MEWEGGESKGDRGELKGEDGGESKGRGGEDF